MSEVEDYQIVNELLRIKKVVNFGNMARGYKEFQDGTIEVNHET